MGSRNVSFAVGLALAALCSLTFAPAALAGIIPIPVDESLDPAQRDDSGYHTNALCQLGVPGGPFFNFLLGSTQPISIYQLLDPASCTVCNPRVLQITSVNFLGRFATLCPATIEVSIVEAVGAPGCLSPDTLQVLCAPISVLVTPANTSIQTYSIPYSCCISRKAYLRFKIPTLGTCTQIPAIRNLTSCAPCQTFYQDATFFVDYCQGWQPGFVGTPVIWADADCCDPTSTERKSWGTLKTIYR